MMETINKEPEVNNEKRPDETSLKVWNRLLELLSPALEDFPRVPQQTRSREKRDRLLEAAERLFVERGYEIVSSDDIADAAEVSVGTFYKYFKNKRQVLLTLILGQFEDIITTPGMWPTQVTADNHREAIRQAYQTLFKTSRRHQKLARAWFELIMHDESLATFQHAFEQEIIERLLETLRGFVEQGLTWPNLDVEATAILINRLNGQASLSISQDELDEVRKVEAITDIVDRAIFRTG
jgi:AcrR family transcriptional regulator